jgi:DNA-directed RNA polymerase specialized sigma subunit
LAEVEDLVQVGWIGLLKAARDFRPELGFAFSTYATAKISGEILRFVRDLSIGPKPPRSLLHLHAQIRARSLNDKDVAQIAKELSVPETAVRETQTMFSVPMGWSDREGDWSLEEMVGSADDYGDFEVIWDFSRTLPAKLQRVFSLWLNGKNQYEIAEIVGSSQKQISVYYQKIRASLAEFLELDASQYRRKRSGSKWEKRKNARPGLHE